ncbi:MAG: dephospho-CoA kinase [Pirellulales bacterium]|nr:dephospho-CoA kinase [Pirellulales bacterium]
MKPLSQRPLVIGLVGGVASGKTFVARTLARWGAVVFDADAAGHRALTETSVKLAARDRWGDRVFDDNGEIDRKKLAEVVFGDSDQADTELEFLEQLTHPVISNLMRLALEQARCQGAQAFVLDAAVMLKAGWHNECDDVLFVETPRELRLARALKRGWSESHFDSRESAQELLSAKRQLATVIIDNSGNEEQTRRQLSEYWHKRFHSEPS